MSPAAIAIIIREFNRAQVLGLPRDLRIALKELAAEDAIAKARRKAA